jgi:hypothetical protein
MIHAARWIDLGSARVSRVDERVLAIANYHHNR